MRRRQFLLAIAFTPCWASAPGLRAEEPAGPWILDHPGSEGASSVSFDADSSKIYCHTPSGVVGRWRLEDLRRGALDGETFFQLPRGNWHAGANWKWIAGVADDGRQTLSIYSMQDGQLVRQFRPEDCRLFNNAPGTGFQPCVTFSPDGRFGLSPSQRWVKGSKKDRKSEIFEWHRVDLESGAVDVLCPIGMGKPVYGGSAERPLLAVLAPREWQPGNEAEVGKRKEVRQVEQALYLLDNYLHVVASGQLPEPVRRAGDYRAHPLAISSDGQFILGSYANTALAWRVEGREIKLAWRDPVVVRGINRYVILGLSPAANVFAMATCYSTDILIRDLATGKVLLTLDGSGFRRKLDPQGANIELMAELNFSPDGRYLILGSMIGEPHSIVFDLGTDYLQGASTVPSRGKVQE